MISQIVTKIEKLLSEVAALQKKYVEEVCPGCENPCCTRVHYIFSQKDLLFLRLSRRKPDWKREFLMTKGCWFLGPTGCTLEPETRPFICHRYICSDLEKMMKTVDPGLRTALEEKFKAIGELRGQMRDELRIGVGPR